MEASSSRASVTTASDSPKEKIEKRDEEETKGSGDSDASLEAFLAEEGGGGSLACEFNQLKVFVEALHSTRFSAPLIWNAETRGVLKALTVGTDG